MSFASRTKLFSQTRRKPRGSGTRTTSVNEQHNGSEIQ